MYVYGVRYVSLRDQKRKKTHVVPYEVAKPNLWFKTIMNYHPKKKKKKKKILHKGSYIKKRKMST